MKDINFEELNSLIKMGKKIAKIIYVLIIIVGAYAFTILIKELGILKMLFTILSVISPLFIGLIIAWLLDPMVTKLKEKGIKRLSGTIISYLLFLGVIGISTSLILPAVSDQIDQFVHSLPSIYDKVEGFVDKGLTSLESIDGFDKEVVRKEIFANIDDWFTELPKTLPTITIDLIKNLFEGLGALLLGLIVGFYLLISFDSTADGLATLIPKKIRLEFGVLTTELNQSLRGFVQGTMLLSLIVFVVTYISLLIIGVKGALLLAIFCGITNIIPIAGPYIGGFPVIIVAFSQNITVGFIALIIIVLLQFFEGNFLHPILLSKTMKLHPVTIILSLLIFGYFFGIIGMILATPIISVLKTIFKFLDAKYAILKFNG